MCRSDRLLWSCIGVCVLAASLGACRLDLQKSDDSSDSTSGSGSRVDADSGGRPTKTTRVASSPLVGVPCTAVERLALAQPLPKVDGDTLEISGLTRIESDASIYNVTVNIAPGTTFVMAADTSLVFGPFGDKTTVNARGTEALPIRFCGELPKPGYWGGVTFDTGVKTSSWLEQVEITGGGGRNQAPLTVAVSMTLADVDVHDNASAVSITVPLSEESQNLTITGSSTYPLAVTAAAIPGLPESSSFTGNARDAIYVSSEGASLVWRGTVPNFGVPYAIDATLFMKEGSDITLSPGTEFVFESGYNYQFLVGQYGDRGRLTALGTPDAPIIFRSSTGMSGSWGGLVLESGAATDSRLDYVQVSDAPLTLTHATSVTNSTFSNSPGFGIRKASSDSTDYRQSNQFAGNAKGDVGP